MNVRLGLGLAVCVGWITACDKKAPEEMPPAAETAITAEGAAGKEEAKPEPVPPPPTPEEICGKIVAAAKEKDEAAFLALATAATSEAFANEELKEHLLSSLGGLTCGAATVEADHAKVAATSGEEAAKEVLLVKDGEAWKLDSDAYLKSNPAPDKKAKGGKGKKAKPAKGKKGRH